MTRCAARICSLVPALVLLGSFSTAAADDVPYRIHSGRDYRGYTIADLQRRVYELEQAVMQLQQRIYHLEATPVMAPPPPPPPPWTCTVTAFSRTYVQTSPSRGEADALVRKQCADASHAMHCTNVRCSQ